MIATVISGLIMMRKGRLSMEVFNPKLVKLWKDWELRAMVITSLLVQIILVLLGNRRKYIPNIKIRAIIWCSYLLADSVATIALGILSNNLGELYDVGGILDLNTELTAFWAPFLLLHLGGPDTITAYAMEDNQLWLRHFFGFILQTVMTGYIILMAWSNSPLSLLNIFMFVVGSVKYGERTWSLWKASSNELRNSMLDPPDPGTDYSKLNEYRLKQAEGYSIEIKEIYDVWEGLDVTGPVETTPGRNNIIKAHALFQKFKCLFADLILSFTDRDKSQSLFEKMSYKDAFDVVAIGLGFMYDMLYTKATIVHTSWGSVSRFTSLFFTFVVLMLFSLAGMQNCMKVDIIITFLLLGAAICLEIYAALVLLQSDQSKYLSVNGRKNTVFKKIDSLAQLFKLKRWSSCMPQLSLLNICLKEKPWPRLLQKVVEKCQPETYVEVDDHLKKLIFENVKGKFNQFKENQDDANFRFLCSQRGNNILERYGARNLDWSINIEFDQSILIWHVATELCHYKDFQSIISCDVQSSREVSKCISKYMIYLLVIYPFLLPMGIGFIRFRDTQANVERILRKRLIHFRTEKKNPINCINMLGSSYSSMEPMMTMACHILLQEHVDVLSWELKVDSSKSVLVDACRLASALDGVTDKRLKWDMIRDVWLEMLAYAACQSKGSQHCQQLRRGGELLSHVWLLMAHFGLSEQFQLSETLALLNAK